jgi:hypothetical protein
MCVCGWVGTGRSDRVRHESDEDVARSSVQKLKRFGRTSSEIARGSERLVDLGNQESRIASIETSFNVTSTRLLLAKAWVRSTSYAYRSE